jgi:hypothetical protein
VDAGHHPAEVEDGRGELLVGHHAHGVGGSPGGQRLEMFAESVRMGSARTRWAQTRWSPAATWLQRAAAATSDRRWL